jgi:hypothetical protein
MKFISAVIFCSFIGLNVFTQANHVFSGGELLNYGTIDISSFTKITWSSDRSRIPGYFSVIDNGKFIGYSDDANINGYIKKYGSTSFLFPVGNGKDLRTLEISAPKINTDVYAVAWIEGDPSHTNDQTFPHAGEHPVNAVRNPIKAVSKVGQWDWQVGSLGMIDTNGTGDGSDLMITVSIPDMRDFGETNALRLVGWNGTSWIDLSGRATANGNIEDSQLSGKMIAGISAIGIGRINLDAVDNDEPGGFLLYPNPVTHYENIHLRFNSNYAGQADLIVFDATGRTVMRNKVECKSGVNTILVDVKILSSGSYYLSIIGVNGNVIGRGKRFIKQ